jgi:hypothetical protein
MWPSGPLATSSVLWTNDNKDDRDDQLEESGRLFALAAFPYQKCLQASDRTRLVPQIFKIFLTSPLHQELRTRHAANPHRPRMVFR